MKNIIYKLIVFFSIKKIFSSKKDSKGALISDTEYESLCSQIENKGKRLSIIGYPYITEDISISRIFSDKFFTQIQFYDQPDAQGDLIGTFPIKNGKDKNQFSAPETYRMTDVIFYDHYKQELNCYNKIQISFTLQFPKKNQSTDPQDKTVLKAFPTNIRIDKAT